MLTIGIDIGTTSICGVLYDSDGNFHGGYSNHNIAAAGPTAISGTGCSGAVLAVEHLPNTSGIPSPHPWEKLQDPSVILETACAVLDRLLQKGRPQAIGLTGQMHGILCLNKQGAPVTPLYTWQDGRCDLPAPANRTWAQHLTNLTGTPFYTGFGLATWYWLSQNNELPQGAYKICTIADYIAMALSGETTPSMDATMAASLGGFSLKNRTFDASALSRAGIGAQILPTLTPSGATIGFHRSGAEILCACGDNQASFYAVVDDPSTQICINVGTGSQVSCWGEELLPAEFADIRPFFNRGYLYVAASLNGGAVLADLAGFFTACCENLGVRPSKDIYEVFADLAGEGGEALTVDPNFYGVRGVRAAGGAISIITAESFTPGALVRGFYDGMAAELAGMLDMLPKGALSGKSYLRGAGNGLRKNRALTDRLAAKTNMPLELRPFPEEGALGAAMCALHAKTKTSKYI